MEGAPEDTPRLVVSSSGAGRPGDGAGPADRVVDEFAERPELFVGAAFAGGFAIAQILKLFRR
jgi:hypothetical protein